MSQKQKKQGAYCTIIIVLLLVFVLLLGGMMGVTMAWLIDSSNQVVNTFTYGDISITLTETETDLDEDNDPTTNTYEMVPGQTITKDPLITVKRGSEDHWLFVKLEKSGGANNNFDEYLTYIMADGWKEIDDGDGDINTAVYYRIVSKDINADQEFPVIADNRIIVLSTVTKEMINALDKDADGNELAVKLYPQLEVTAYAVQLTATSENNPDITEDAAREEANALEAWALTEGVAPDPYPVPEPQPPADPTNVTVNNVDELRSAVANADAEHKTINMAAGTYEIGDFDILAGKDITLKAIEGEEVIIAGQMTVESNLTIEGITFNCSGQAPVLAKATVTTNNCILNCTCGTPGHEIVENV